MSYLVLARKYRPHTFDEMVGQEFIARTLRNAIRTNRVAHAFLFTGCRGVGKTTTARILAKCLNCDHGPTEEPCNECPSCLEINEGRSLDVYEIDGASNTSVDDIRELRENIKYLPRPGKRRVYIIDEVHMLSKSAFNALLKTLEEPPEHVVFAFATTEPHKVPETIQSRVQRFDLRRIPRAKIQQRLREMASAEGIAVEDSALAWVAKAADGSMRDGQSLFDQIISYCGTSVTEEAVMDILGIAGRELFFKISEAVLAKDAGRCIEVLSEVIHSGHDINQFYQNLVEHFRNLLITRIMPDPSSVLDLSEGEIEDLKKQAQPQHSEDLRRLVSFLLKAEEDVLRSSFPQMSLEIVLIKMAHLSRLEPLDKILKKIDALEQSPHALSPPVRNPVAGMSPARPSKPLERSAPAPGPKNPSPVTVNPPPAPLMEKKAPLERKAEAAERNDSQPSGVSLPVVPFDRPEAWPHFIKAVRKEREVMASLLEDVARWEIDSSSVKVFYEEGSFFYEKLQQASEKALLTRIAKDCFGPAFIFKVSPLHSSEKTIPEARSTASRTPSPPARSPQIEAAGSDPAVKTAMEVFKGTITDVKTITSDKPDESK